MNRKVFRRTISFVLVLFVLLGIFNAQMLTAENTLSQESAGVEEVLLAFDFENGKNVVSQSNEANAEVTVESNTTNLTVLNGLNASRGNTSYVLQSLGWDVENAYWQIKFSALGYQDLKLSSAQASSWRGPSDFHIEFSLDGTTWSEIKESYPLQREWNLGLGVTDALPLPAEARDQEEVFIRWSRVGEGDVSKTGLQSAGQSWIDNIVVTGTAIPEEVTPPETPGEESEAPIEGVFVLAAFDFEENENKVSESTPENASAVVECNAQTPTIKTGLRADRGNEGPVLQSMGWDADNTYWQLVVSTLGYSDIELSYLQASSWRGPRFFDLEYSVDGLSWEKIVAKYELDRTWGGDFGAFKDLKLPPAADNQDKVYIRWSKVNGTDDVSGEGVRPDGQSWLDDIKVVAKYQGVIERVPNILRVDWEAKTTRGNYWWAISKEPYVFQAGDVIEYDVYIANAVPGLGAIEVYAKHPDNGDYKFREQYLTGEWEDQNGISGVPATDLSPYAYGKWYHRKLTIPASVVGSPIRDFTLGIDNKDHAAGDVFRAYYRDIKITNQGETQHVIYKEGDPDVSVRVSPLSNKNYDVTLTPVFYVEAVEPIEVPEEEIPTGDPIVDETEVFNVGLILNSKEMQASKGFGITNYTIEEPPVLKNGVVYVPLYTVFEEMGAALNWDAATQTVSIKQAKNTATHKLGASTLVLNGKTIALEGASYGLNHSTLMVPLSFFEHFGVQTSYFAENGRIKLRLPQVAVSYTNPLPVHPVEEKHFSDDEIAFRFFISSDSQGTDQGFYEGTDDGTGRGYDLVLDQMKKVADSGQKPDFIIGGGDLVAGTPGHVIEENKAQLANWRTHFEARFDINLFMPIPGNHEQKGEKIYLTQSFQEMFPEFNARTDVVFAEGFYGTVWYYDVGDARIFGLNNTFSGTYHKITGSQFDFVKNHIDPTKKQTFFVMHEPPFSTWKSGNGMDRFELERDKFWELIETAPNPLVFVGHEHMYSRKLVNNRFNETVEGESFDFKKQIYQVHIAGFGGGTNGVTRDYRAVVTDPATIGLWHFGIVEVLKDGRIHFQARDYNGNLLDDFVQERADTEVVTPNRVSFPSNELVLRPQETVTHRIAEPIEVVYTTGDASVATVDANGVITARGTGETYITATAEGGAHFGGAFAAVHVVVPGNEDMEILQVNAHVGKDAQTTQNISWTMKRQVNCDLAIKDATGNIVQTKTVSGELNGLYTNYRVELSQLTPGTLYTYVIDNGFQQVTGEFKTASDNRQDTVRFAYIADPQVSNAANAEAAGAVFHYLQEEAAQGALDFIYIAGDHTDKNADDAQWQYLFHNAGLYPEATQNFLLHHTLLSAQGNHDDGGLHGRINPPNALGLENEFANGVFASDFGPVKFIMLNNASYNVANLSDNPGIRAQETFLREEVAKAKDEGMWTIVGFHKPIYTGASHIDDNDVIAYRKFWNPILAELDVDFVLAGHDHVYSRGFVDAYGTLQSQLTEEAITYYNGHQAPLHMVAGHAGGLKWYAAIDYAVQPGDLLVPNYRFLDKNSALETPPSGEKQEQTYVIVEISPDEARFKTVNFKYAPASDSVVTEPYVYDAFSVMKLELGEDVPDSTTEPATTEPTTEPATTEPTTTEPATTEPTTTEPTATEPTTTVPTTTEPTATVPATTKPTTTESTSTEPTTTEPVTSTESKSTERPTKDTSTTEKSTRETDVLIPVEVTKTTTVPAVTETVTDTAVTEPTTESTETASTPGESYAEPTTREFDPSTSDISESPTRASDSEENVDKGNEGDKGLTENAGSGVDLTWWIVGGVALLGVILFLLYKRRREPSQR